MKIRQFIIHNIRINLPLFIVFAAFSVIMGITSTMSQPLYTSGYSGLPYSKTTLLSLCIVPLIFAIVYPMTIFSYRYKRPSVDFFYQMPIDKRFTKRVKIIIGLIVLFSVFSINYFFNVLLLFIRTITSNEVTNVYLSKINYNFAGFFAAYPLLLVGILTTFAISLFFASLSNNKKDMILLWAFGSIILFTILSSFVTVVYSFMSINHFYKFQNEYDINHPLTLSLLPTAALFTPIAWMEELILNKPIELGNALITTLTIFFYIASILLGIAGFLYAFFLKERSGECASRSGGYNLLTTIVPHFAYFLIGLYVSVLWYLGATSYFIVPILISMMYIVGYYFSLVWYYKKLKINKSDLIIYICVNAFIFTLSLAMVINTSIVSLSMN